MQFLFMLGAVVAQGNAALLVEDEDEEFESDTTEAVNAFEKFRVDSMGKRTIIYWPGLTLAD